MVAVQRNGCFFFLIFFLFIGCTYQRAAKLPPPGQPEHVYVASRAKELAHARVGVFGFLEPLYAPGAGRAAAESVYYELRRHNDVITVFDETGVVYSDEASMLNVARALGYEFIVTGELLYYASGVAVQPSRVAERIRIVHVPTQAILWDCATVDSAFPLPDTDYFVAFGEGAPPVSATELLHRNAKKFCNLLFDKPPS